MPRRNIYLLLAITLVSLACYKKADSAYRSRTGRMFDTFVEVLGHIDRDYIEPVDDRELFEAALKGMVHRLGDPYSDYDPPRVAAEFQEHLQQEFGGIGIEVVFDPESEWLTVANPIMGTPAYDAGILAGDTIVGINGESTHGFTTEDAVARLRGKPGAPVSLEIRRAGQEKTLEIVLKRAVIQVPSVLGDSRDAQGRWSFQLDRDPRIGYLRVNTFGEQTVSEMEKALKTLSEQKIQGLILDLRNNSGGYLHAARGMCDLFLREGRIVSTRGRDKKKDREVIEASGNALYTDWPMAVLVNHQSASASEIVAACLQDNERAVIVGERTYGKGKVQNVIPLEGGKSALRLTVATFWSPNGRNIDRGKDPKPEGEWGVVPNDGFLVPLTDEQARQLLEQRYQHYRPGAGPVPQGVDLQLDKAVEHLKRQLDRVVAPPAAA